jgi:hypothetical protein
MSLSRHPDSHYIETPRGIFTSAGNWFHITGAALDKYAPGLLEIHSLETMIKKAEVWIRSADNIGIILFMLLLYLSGPWPAVLITLFFVPVWHINKSSVINLPLTGLLTVIDKEIVVVIVAMLVLSWMGVTGEYLSVFLGVAVFCVLKFGWLRFLVEWVYEKLLHGTLLLNDRVLKMIIINYAIRENIPVKEVDAMEKEILSLIGKQQEVIRKYRNRK